VGGRLLLLDDQKAKIMILDNPEVNLEFLELCLTHHFDLQFAASKNATKLIERLKPDIIILKEDLDGGNKAFELCNYIRTSVGDRYIGIIFMSDYQEADIATKALNAGADDFFSIQTDEFEILARCRSVLRYKRVVDKLHTTTLDLLRANQKLEKLAITDELTRLSNMRYFNQRFSQEFERAIRYNINLSFIIFDVDHFKQVNDKNNHLVGSGVLAKMGDLVREAIRKSDLAARYGGDEYVILLPQTNLDSALLVAERLRKRVEGFVLEVGDFKVKVTLSIGVACAEGSKTEYKEPSDLMQAADAGLYQAKDSGRNNVVGIKSTDYYKYKELRHLKDSEKSDDDEEQNLEQSLNKAS
jgi:two-component system chemotaxis family response regulator WspR